jgi:hypothetical protein
MTQKLEELKQLLTEEDNDLKALGIHNQILREKRLEKFENYREKIFVSPKVEFYSEHSDQGKVTLVTFEFGTIDYYPKANKVLIRKDNKWIKPGLNWLIKNLL